MSETPPWVAVNRDMIADGLTCRLVRFRHIEVRFGPTHRPVYRFVRRHPGYNVWLAKLAPPESTEP